MPLARTKRLIVQEMEDETLVYDLKTNKAVCLNPTAKLVWQKCAGRTNISDVSRFLNKNVESQANKVIIGFALRELKEADLLQYSCLNIEEPAVSRRDLIAKYGIPIATLPVIMSLVAPVAAVL